MKTVAIMQPYFLSHPPYFQLAAASDQFVLCDNFQYTRKGWINRNQFLQNGKATPFALPLVDAPRSATIAERTIAPCFDPNALLRRWQASYQKSPHFCEVQPLLQEILFFPNANLFAFIENSIRTLLHFVGLTPPITKTSDLNASREFNGEKRVIAMCEELGAERYINSIGGIELYSRQAFKARKVHLQFLKPTQLNYRQFDNPFVPHLSVLDLLMFESAQAIRNYLVQGYELI